MSSARFSGLAELLIGALPSIVLLAAYNFLTLSIFHQAYLQAYVKIQEALRENIPPDAPVAADDDIAKEFAPLNVVYRHVTVVDEADAPPQEAYVAMLLRPGQSLPQNWTENRASREIKNQIVGLESRPPNCSACPPKD